eukprot:CAMPEP_0197624346 /NCGR_PEP_ID=MMETSP1338-20131121/4023_1 /TAXON_ID=43686 ORGANISM="Pelagodinium beii, Strain RCC1491" /NCGR_SAMPLE_ID=MMETSP1338 /ASSEMBLY_ACC=CAM_ASM_000754 /LENGTH=219 /DNA_ID=CAMNT_0043194471 /DNA_START=177 /DNA_END=836 /DNA_ORIENTATION=+
MTFLRPIAFDYSFASHKHWKKYNPSLPSVVAIYDSQAYESGLFNHLNVALSTFVNLEVVGGAGTCLTRNQAGCNPISALMATQSRCAGKKVLLWCGVNDVKVINGAGAGFKGYMQSFINGIRSACPGVKFVIVQSPLFSITSDPEWPPANIDAMNNGLSEGCQWASGEADVLAVCNTNSFFRPGDFAAPKGRTAHFGPTASGTQRFKDAIVVAAQQMFR